MPWDGTLFINENSSIESHISLTLYHWGQTERYAMIAILLFNWAEVDQAIQITSFKSHAKAMTPRSTCNGVFANSHLLHNWRTFEGWGAISCRQKRDWQTGPSLRRQALLWTLQAAGSTHIPPLSLNLRAPTMASFVVIFVYSVDFPLKLTNLFYARDI